MRDRQMAGPASNSLPEVLSAETNTLECHVESLLPLLPLLPLCSLGNYFSGPAGARAGGSLCFLLPL